MKVFRVTTLALLVTAMPAMALAQAAAERVEVQDAYVRAVPPGQANSAAFLTLSNADDSDHALVAGRSDAAKTVELHTHINDQGIMRMRRIDRIDLPAGSEQTLEPGGLHIMLIGLTRQLQSGEEVSLTLEFEDGSSVALQAPVRPIEGMGGGHDHMHHKH
jgi:copper(I)-binding protein